mmetsp:Transcript_8192/g.9534  ORF Transcript_8192/g.9534 Transcript_8192/m.9534 type:complete len:233 (-) Transcript_8192:167-865(-)
MKQFPLLAFFVAPSTHHRSSSIGTRIIRSNKNDGCGLLRLFSVNNVDGRLSDTNLEPSAGVYEAVIPQTETLVGMGVIVILCVALYLVWENQVVPVSRTKLAISKKRGEIREYLDELKVETTSTKSIEDTVADKSNNAHTKNAISSSVSSPLSSSSLSSPKDRVFERWLFNDWLGDNKSEGKKAGRQKEPALPILKSAKWNSGDNPVVVAVLLMMIGVFITALTERIASISG